MTRKLKKLRILIAITLALVLGLIYPLQVTATVVFPYRTGATASTTTPYCSSNEQEEETQPAQILAEVEEDRDENTKHFRMSDGSFMAVQYEYPVHYQNKDGGWVEYDNQMKEAETQPITDAPTEALTAPATEPAQASTGASGTAPPASATNATETQGTEETSNTPPETTTDTVETQPVNTLSDTADDNAEYENKKSDLDIRLAKKAKKNNMVKIKGDGYQVSWGFAGISKSKVEFVNNNEKLEGNDKFLVRKNLVQEALYKDAFPNVDMQYLVTPVGVKENIILKNKDAQTSFTIEYKTKGLTATKKNDYTIELKNKDGKVVYEIYAPFMTDAKGEKSTQLGLEIKSQKKNKLTVVLSADKEWLNDAKREFPVTVDPSFNTSQSWQNTACSYIDSAHASTAYGYGSESGYTGTVYAGTFGQGNYRSFLKMNKLPTLNNGDIIVGAYLNMHLYQDNFYDDMYVGAYHVKDSWKQSTVTWNNRPNFEANIVDYTKLYKDISKKSPWLAWNVTKSVKRWYSGETNNGIMLKPVDEATNAQCAAFYSSNHPISSIARPVFTILYRNNKGLEDYWTYTSFNVGTAGTAYVNDYTGNLVFIHNDASTGGSLMPLSISHVFNNYMAGKHYDKFYPLTGKGWRVSIEQTVLPSSQFGLKDAAAKLYPFVYTDSDGTDHYFRNKGTEEKPDYGDEDGLKLKLAINKSSIVAYYTITDEKDNKMEFRNNGRLHKIISANGKFIYVKYDPNDEKKILYVHDGAEQRINFVSNPSGSGSLYQMTDPASRKKTFYYSTVEGHSGYMERIQNQDATNVYFTYDSTGSLASVKDIDGYRVEFTYSSTSTGKQVTAIQEYGTDGKAGQKITFDRSKINSTVIQTSGVDGVYGNDDDLKATKQFDDYGRTKSLKNQTGNRDMGAAGCQYTSGEPNSDGSNLSQINRVTNEYHLGSNAVNLLKNHNMETTGSWTSAAWGGTNTFTAANTTAQKYMGKQSLKINTTAVSGTSSGRVYQDVVLKPNTSYTLSAYVKTTGFDTSIENAGALIGATSFNASNAATDFASDKIRSTTDTSINGGWRRLTLTFRVPADSVKIRLNLALRGTTGTAYFDAVQLEEYNIVNTYNMLENSSLENYTGALPTGWTGSGLSSADVKTTDARTGSYAFQIKGDPSKEKLLSQSVNITGVEEDTYILSGWAKANAALEEDGNNKKFKLSVKVSYSTGDPVWKKAAEFNSAVSDWQFASSAFTLSDGTSTKRTPVKIEVYANYSNQINTAVFDNIQLIKDVAQSYTYDKDGHIITVQKDAEQKGTTEYTNADLTKSIDSKGYAYTYEYDSKHNMTKATSQRGLISTYTYDKDTGVPTQFKVQNPGKNASLLSTNSYTDNRAYVNKSSDQDGNEVTYNYDQNRGTLLSTSDSSGTVNYTYNEENDLLTSVAKTINNGQITVQNQYMYDSKNRNLTRIVHNGTNYYITYDSFNNKTKTSVGSQTIAAYTYGANNGLLQKQTYGTGQYVGFTYDPFGNIATQSYNGTTAFKWFSDRTGAATRHQDLINKIQYDSDYDVTGRLVRQNSFSTENGKSLFALEYGYDLNNNVSKLVNIADGKTAKNEYVYGKDNLPEKYTIDGGRNVTYTYDSLNRLTNTSIATTKPIDTEYKYWRSQRNTGESVLYKTTKISEESIGGEKFIYYYDDQGNIISIKKMSYNADGTEAGYTTPVAAYEYDELGQLVHETIGTGTEQKKYSYDAGGNLLKETLEIWSGGRVISSTVTNYGYEDSNWKDKLTSYGGKAITYDEIGNPLSYRNMTMTWQNGRQLASLQKGTTAVSYTYDANSTRATKTVNGVKYTYQYVGGKLIHETRGEKSFHYYYDANGYLTAIKYRLTPDGQDFAYYATHNWRGDVIGLYNGDGELRAKYEYDTWGKVTSVKDANGTRITDQNHVGNLNPFRYRGYYYDTESQLYYLMTRYYDPVVHRFINADGYFQSGNGLLDTNMNAYCLNDPVNRSDSDGRISSREMQKLVWTGKYTIRDVLLRQKEEQNEQELAQGLSYEIGLLGANILITAMNKQANKYISNAVRPNNIGAGLFAKQQASQLSQIKTITAKATKGIKTLGKIASVAAVVTDVGVGIYDNVQNNASAGKIAADALVDVGFTLGNIVVAGAIGAAAGSVVPGIGTVVGFAAGVLISLATDVWVGSNGRTMRDTVKDGIRL